MSLRSKPLGVDLPIKCVLRLLHAARRSSFLSLRSKPLWFGLPANVFLRLLLAARRVVGLAAWFSWPSTNY
jgi:hypothetical protein